MIDLPFRVGMSENLKIRGLIATRPIKKNQEIERCPLILIDRKREEKNLRQTVLWKYYFEYSEKYYCIVLGYGSLVNHSYTPNCRYGFNFRSKEIFFKAISDIRPGEEITINYNYITDSRDPLPEELVDYNVHLK